MRSNIIILFLLVIYLNIPLHSQATREWVNRYNGSASRYDIANSLKLDAAGNVHVYGTVSSLDASTDITAVKYNSAGAVLWSALFNGYGNSVDAVSGSYLDNSGSSYITGYTADTNLIIKMITLKYNSSGNLLWSKTFLPQSHTTSRGHTLLTDASGDVIVCGSLRRPNGSFSLAVLKYSSTGVLTATAIFNKTAASSEPPVSICMDGLGYYYVLCSSNAADGSDDVLILKYDNSLNLIRQYTFGGIASASDIPVQIITGNDNRLVVCAGIYNAGRDMDYCLLRLDTNLTPVWNYFYDGPSNNRDLPYSVASDSLNNIYVTGSSRNADTLGSEDFLTLKLGSIGQLQWAKRYNGTGRGIDYGASVTVDRLGNVYAGGAADKHDNHVGYALLKYGPGGDLKWLEEYSALDSSEDFIYTVAIDNAYNIFVTGISFDSLSDYDITTIKYSQPIGITQISSEVPASFELFQNYPNPFNPETNVSFAINYTTGSGKRITLKIYDVRGRLVETIFDDHLSFGTYTVKWNSLNYPSGVYFCALKSGVELQVKKMLLIK
ncbi:MAG: SBBP repeat-containing protein [Ignavibacteria bacterium]|nr:SBBP repeat-containing protein [Ignavibacteria bacterium]